jgi:hypothetical protein
MAERSSSSEKVTMASPLYSEGVHHAEVTTPMSNGGVPDPLGFLGQSSYATIKSMGSGDDVNDWKDTSFPDEGGEG